MTSDKPAARRLRKWVTSEVIPTIRRTGSYSLPSAQQYPSLTPEDRSDVEGIIKRVVASQIRPLFQMQAVDHSNIVALTQEIAAIRAAPVVEPVGRGLCPDYWPMLEIVKAAGIDPRGRRQLVHR